MVSIDGFQSSGEGSSPLHPHQLFLKLIETKEEKQLYFEIVQKFHSYVPQKRVVGRHIGWLILLDNKPIGSIGLSSYFLPEPKVLKDFIGWEKEQFNENFNKVSVNWRFTLTPEAPKNIGSQVLGLLAKVAPKEWYKKYRNELVLLVSLVGAGKSGTVYKASGWQLIGKTAGSVCKKSTSGKTGYTLNKKWAKKNNFQYGKIIRYERVESKQKLIFVKPLHPQWKLLLNSVSI